MAAFAYFSSVLQRASLGVAGLDAQERFVVSAAALSMLAVVQVIVYAGMQIPVGIFLDRLGPRTLMIGGSLLMALGQYVLAFTTTFGVALGARVCVGMGDALIFNSALRLVVSWFSSRRATQLTQITGSIGQLGQLLSALPFAVLVKAAGWTPAFVSVATVSALAAILLWVAVRDVPRGAPAVAASQVSLVLRRLRLTVARPGTWLAFWVHFITVPSGSVIGLLWGMPLFQEALGYSHEISALLLMVPVGVSLVAGPVLGLWTARLPRVRVGIAAGTGLLALASWSVFILWPGLPPTWFVLTHMIIIGLGGPVSVIAFDLARSTNPNNSLGVANGVVNVGGFTSSFIMLFLVGLMLDVVHSLGSGADASAGLYAFDSFRVAFAVMQIIPLVGLGMLWVSYRQTKRRSAMTRAHRNNSAPAAV